MPALEYDLEACLRYNPQPAFTAEDITATLAVIYGENDGAPWHWVVALRDGRHAYVSGSCDYTGWDCQSSAGSEITATATAAARCHHDAKGARELLRQIKTNRQLTPREIVGKELFT